MKKIYKISMSSVGVLSVIAAPTLAFSAKPYVQKSFTNQMLKSNFSEWQLDEIKKDSDYVDNIDLIKVKVEKNSSYVQYLGLQGLKPVFKIYTDFDKKYYIYKENSWVSDGKSRQDVVNRCTRILNLFMANVSVVTKSKVETFYDDSYNIVFKSHEGKAINTDTINFLSSWGVSNSDGGHGTIQDKIDMKGVYDGLLDKATKHYKNNKYVISNQKITLSNLYIAPLIDVTNPPIRSGQFTIKKGSLIDGNKVIEDNKSDMLLPSKASEGLAWYAGIVQLLSVGLPLASIITGLVIGNPIVIALGVGHLVYSIYNLLKDTDGGIYTEKMIKQAFDKAFKKSNKILISPVVINGRDDTLDIDLDIDYSANANATGFFGDRTEAKLNQVAFDYDNPTVAFDYSKYTLKDFKN